jgi:quercetin dioxygenase-like cupin family protein
LLSIALVFLGFNSISYAKKEISMKGSIQKDILFKKESKTITPLFSDAFKVIGIGLMKGQKLDKHETPNPAFLYVESGQISFSMENTTTNLNPGDFFKIPAQKIHELEATKDSKLLLIK